MDTYLAGEHVKVEFLHEATGQNEWMWLLVESADDERRLLWGVLDNEPVVHTFLRRGEHLAVEYDRIREHRRF